jgi:hypothetical protein
MISSKWMVGGDGSESKIWIEKKIEKECVILRKIGFKSIPKK